MSKQLATALSEAPIRHVADYFVAIAPIWDAYYDGRISAITRDALLAAHRKLLPTLPLSSLDAK